MGIAPGEQLGPYRIVELLGSGGMGRVFRARDSRLDRDVAIKVLADCVSNDPAAAARFAREAKAVARLSHPNILSIHDFSSEAGLLYAVTELLEGETLREALERGAFGVERAVRIAGAIAEGLAAAHERGVIHRDLKPENIFLTHDERVKILDFGLAVASAGAGSVDTTSATFVTAPGLVVGTIGYMSPEQIRGEQVTASTDLFALGCVLYEMLSHKRPFERPTALGTMAAFLTDSPPPLDVRIPAELRRIVLRCLEKDPGARFGSAHELLSALMSVERSSVAADQVTAVHPRTVTHSSKRLIVLPFRLLRPDPEFDFLSGSLPEAITTSLAKLESLIVRSTAAASRFASDQPDLRAISREADVDWIVTGSLLRGGQQIRVSAQLLEAATAAVLWSHTFETSVRDIFQIQDELTTGIVESLSVPLSERERRNLRRDVPSSALAYELFLRANQQGHSAPGWTIARDLYLQAIEDDPEFAPAHARLARVQWLLAKYTDGGAENWALAEQSLERALQINPDLPLAHRLYAELEIDVGRAEAALARLLDRLRLRQNDPELCVALVKACRYCGLLDQSLEMHARARALDPKITSSVAHTYLMQQDYEGAWEAADRRGDIGYLEPLILAMKGDRRAALEAIARNIASVTDLRLRAYLDSLRSSLQGDHAGLLAAVALLRPIRDPEALYYVARSLVFGGRHEEGMKILQEIIPGFACVPMLEHDPWLDPIRGDERFVRVLAAARVVRDSAAQRWEELAESPRKVV